MRRVQWDRRAVDDLLAIAEWPIAAAVDAAVQHFARTAEGFVRRVTRDGVPDEYRLYVLGTDRFARIRFDDTNVYVERVFQRP